MLKMSVESALKTYHSIGKHFVNKLATLCETRWVERHAVVEGFHTLFEPLVDYPEHIKNSKNVAIPYHAKSCTEASGRQSL